MIKLADTSTNYIYTTRIPIDLDKEIFLKLTKSVSQYKRKRIFSYLKYDDALRSLFGELLVRYMLAAEHSEDPRKFIISVGPYGKPYIRNWNGSLHFNLAHSGNWVASAASYRPIGIDIEQVSDIEMDVAEHYFSPEENSVLALLSGKSRQKHFFLLWTAKESYIKADGRGLAIPLSSFTVSLSSQSVFFNQEPAERRFLKHYYPDTDYVLAVCAESSAFPNTIKFVDFTTIMHMFLGD
ncbi:phosphopantetheine-protein transferase [Paenibacillus sp. PK3_47]|uniref:4'-phosphopantetheinyl transferase family protein n=1 Tax=Paenibacillus sp. PK3_47 TaxID=2072642 RepID=UPI00201DA3A1|nr:4'-phosphopantetheinyl transferase superfamily protein [Paenibacillus sp. PK3_47]UQZ35479.1 phosphopantetheine-protein transferase [Paenibacillus sp. PK3_47]